MTGLDVHREFWDAVGELERLDDLPGPPDRLPAFRRVRSALNAIFAQPYLAGGDAAAIATLRAIMQIREKYLESLQHTIVRVTDPDPFQVKAAIAECRAASDLLERLIAGCAEAEGLRAELAKVKAEAYQDIEYARAVGYSVYSCGVCGAKVDEKGVCQRCGTPL